MRNTIKKKITKGILLFLFTFFSVGVQGQIDYNRSISWNAPPVTTNSAEYNENGTLTSWLHEIKIPLAILQDLNISAPDITDELQLNINAMNNSFEISNS